MSAAMVRLRVTYSHLGITIAEEIAKGAKLETDGTVLMPRAIELLEADWQRREREKRDTNLAAHAGLSGQNKDNETKEQIATMKTNNLLLNEENDNGDNNGGGAQSPAPETQTPATAPETPAPAGKPAEDNADADGKATA